MKKFNSHSNAIEVSELTKKFTPSWFDKMCARIFRREAPQTKVAVSDVSLHVGVGETVGLLGRNGCGKSSVIRCISMLLVPDAGAVRVFGRDPFAHSIETRRLIGRVSVDASFWKGLSGEENLRHTALLFGLPARETMRQVREWLDEFGVPEREQRVPVRTLSRGTQQKLAIVRALMHRPKILLLDEPTTGLDPAARESVQDFIRRWREKHELSVLLTTHDMEEAERMCDRFVFMTKGRVAAVGSLSEVCRGESSLTNAFKALTGEHIIDLPEPKRLVRVV